MEYQALLQERADLVAKMESIIAAAGTSELTAEQQADFDAAESRLKVVKAAIARHEVVRDEQRQTAAAGSRDVVPATSARISNVHDRREDDPRQAFSGFGDFALAVRSAMSPGGSIDERLRIGAAPTGYMERGGANGEGFMIPAEFRQEIFQLVWDDPLLAQFTFSPTESGRVELLADQTTPWGATGVVAKWRAEATQMTASSFGIKKRTIETDQLYAFVVATNELLRDASQLNDRLTTKASEAIVWTIVEAIIRGTGAGQPLGILTSGVAVEVAKESGQAADSVVAKNVAKMVSRLIKQGGNGFWIANDDVMPELLTMTIGNQPVYLAPNGLAGDAAPGGLLYGRPLYNSEHADTVGDVGDLILVNPAGYGGIQRTAGPEFATSAHLYFDYNMTAFRWTFEIGGRPLLESAITPPNSSATKSHFVTLAARA